MVNIISIISPDVRCYKSTPSFMILIRVSIKFVVFIVFSVFSLGHRVFYKSSRSISIIYQVGYKFKPYNVRTRFIQQ